MLIRSKVHTISPLVTKKNDKVKETALHTPLITVARVQSKLAYTTNSVEFGATFTR